MPNYNHLNTGKFSKVNERKNPIELTESELTVLQNMVLDQQIGSASLRGGFRRWHSLVNDDSISNPLTTTTDKINSIYDFTDLDGNNFLLASAGTELRKAVYSGSLAAWSDIKTGLTAGKMRIIDYGGNFLVTNGVDKPFYVSNAPIGGSTVFNMELVSPNVDGVIIKDNQDAQAGLRLDTGSYRYLFVFVTIDGQRSNPSAQLAMIDSGQDKFLTNSNYDFSLPTTSDTRISTLRIYRTKKNIFSTFYLNKIMNIGDTDVTQTSGSLVVGQSYLIETYLGTDNFTNVGASANVAGQLFIATGTTPTTWTGGTVLRKAYHDIIKDDDLDLTEAIEYMNTPLASKYLATQEDIVFQANIQKQYTNIVIPPPHVNSAGVVASVISGSIDLGVYEYAYSYVDSQGNESNLTHLTTFTSAGAQGVVIGNYAEPLTSDVNTLNPSLAYIYFYRKIGSGQYCYVGAMGISLAATGFTDTQATAAITGNPYPHSANGKAATKIANLSSSVVYSSIYNFLEYPELNYIEINPDNGDVITGISNDDNGIMVFKSNSISKLYTGGSPENWSQKVETENIGCDQPDSIYKHGSIYFFVFRNRPYLFAGGEPKPIGLLFTNTFDSVTDFLGATYYTKQDWYVLTVKIQGSYYLLCYDTKLDTWYKFSINKADCITRKESGADAGKLLIGGANYITTYDETISQDSDSGTNADINVLLTTKTFTFPDNFIMARLRFFFIDYLRQLGTIGQTLTFTINELETGTSLTYLSTVENANQLIKLVTDSMTGTLKIGRKISFTISGASLKQLNSIRLDYSLISRGFGG